MLRHALMLLCLLSLITLGLGCSKRPKVDETATAQTSNQANQAPLPVHRQQNLNGEIERVSLAISTAQEDHRIGKWDEAIKQLQLADKEVDSALGRKLRLREEFEALKAAIGRTIVTLQNRGKEASSQLTELQMRIAAIKVNTPRQPGT
jgi:hypothetical protein